MTQAPVLVCDYFHFSLKKTQKEKSVVHIQLVYYHALWEMMLEKNLH